MQPCYGIEHVTLPSHHTWVLRDIWGTKATHAHNQWIDAWCVILVYNKCNCVRNITVLYIYIKEYNII